MTDDRVSRAVAAYDAMRATGASPASGACAAAAVLGTSPVDALNLMVRAGAVYLESYRLAVPTKYGDAGLRLTRRVPLRKVVG